MSGDYEPRHLGPTRLRRLRILAWRVRWWWQTGAALWVQQREQLRTGNAPEEMLRDLR